MMNYMICSKKIVTVTALGTVLDGAMVVSDGKITAVGKWADLRKQYSDTKMIDCTDKVITPALVDCHTHLLEFAPSSIYPVTPETHLLAGRNILFHALSCGITALGEQVCGHPLCDFSIEDYRQALAELPIDVSFAATSISIGFEKLAHFTSVTGSRNVDQRELSLPCIVKEIARSSEYPGENIFINATPANFKATEVPRAGEIVYTLEELKQIVETYHQLDKRIGCHVAGKAGIQMALDAGFNVLHHAHGITEDQLNFAAKQGVKLVATPIGGTHLKPNSPEDILIAVKKGIDVSISTDAYLPPHPEASWLPFCSQSLKGPDVLMLIAQPGMKLLQKQGYGENEILALLTENPAKILKKEDHFGRLEPGLDANFIVADGVPGLEITDVEQIRKVFYRGKKVIDRDR
ncbi:amidohydrolase family protein [Neobacillus mesonae]|uniref:amidohydrolase family protein n=1 Tax=Neobacillus mesonae TaxID=1193713 RepID=UPI00203A6A1E|nr:amidohydrolase family protein [Neobacillus mesonae]MCM3570382.1 amidohydrolase family protein [Neobacillus mesonae]